MKKRFGILYLTNLFGTLNDNFMKTLAGLVAIGWVSQRYQSLVVAITTISLVLPFVLCSAMAGRLTQRFSKKAILRVAKIVELPIVAISICGFYFENVWVVCFGLLLMGLQSSLYSPSKFGLVRDIGGVENVSVGMGTMESINFMAMLGGTVLASFLQLPWLMAVFAGLGMLSSFFLRANEERDIKPEKVRLHPYAFLKTSYHMAKEYRGLNQVIFTLSVFWWSACVVQMGLFVYCPNVLGLDKLNTGLMVTVAGLGIGIGSVIFGNVDKRRDIIRLVPLAALMQAVLYMLLFCIPYFGLGIDGKKYLTISILFVVSLVSSVFKVPLDAEIQRLVEGPRLSIVLAYFNQVSFLFMVVAAVMFWLLTAVLPVQYMWVMIALGTMAAGVYLFMSYRPAACGFSRHFIRKRYDVRITVDGKPVDPNKEGQRLHDLMMPYTSGDGLLILPNHQAVMDPMMIYAEMYRMQVSPLVEDSYFATGASRQLLSLFDAIKVPSLRKSRKGVELAMALESTTLQALRDKRSMLFYPSGHITLNGLESIGNRSLAYNVCSQLPEGATVMLVHIRGLWGSRWSRYGKPKTPNLPLTLLKGIGLTLIGYCHWHRKRVVNLDFVPMTEQVRLWAEGTKQEFNQHLEDWYNSVLSTEPTW